MKYTPNVGIEYPAVPDSHLVVPEQLVPDPVYDENFPYLDKSLRFRLWNNILYLGVFTIAFAGLFFRYDLRFEGRKILRKYRKELKNGAIIIINHVQSWDALVALCAVRYRKVWLPAWKDNLHGKDRNLIRGIGGIPIPDGMHAMQSFFKAFDELAAKRKWFLVFPESSKWSFYGFIRPFKRGAFVMAQRYNRPIIPMAITYRPAYGIFKLWKKNYPLFTAHIGEPQFLDESLGKREAIMELRNRCHKKMCDLAGIENNPWPPEGD
ncbi:MAG: 1-acyl-sn-glycerol-3-phosphate acyltransferase [Spirochaetaceae bacterium]|jgi:1-acyl-sn-glycerol-3-phosphate acyltransferase|nr:1-acyl-sn-glycerol-3-phosphate acyltransferase [Spirochaetaceae bacterium]